MVTATDADELTAAFETAARSVVTQLAVTAQVPEGIEPGTSELVTTALVGDAPITDSAVAVITSVAAPAASASADPYGPIQVASTAPAVFEQPWFLPVVLVLMFVALVAIVAMAIGALDTKNRQQGRVKRRLEEVSVVGAPRLQPRHRSRPSSATARPRALWCRSPTGWPRSGTPPPCPASSSPPMCP